MTSKERILAAWNGKPYDHVPLTTWCFGFKPPSRLIWEKNRKTVRNWYSLRMEHLHTLTEPWELEDDFKRVLAWRAIGLDDIIDVSVPWSVNPEVSWRDYTLQAKNDMKYPVMVREYETPLGGLRHAVNKTDENEREGWVVQPDHVPLFEDYNVPRAVEHAVSSIKDIPAIKYLYVAPDDDAKSWFKKRMANVRDFAERNSVAVQAWSAFGMDSVVWLMGAEGAILLAIDNPKAFNKLLDIVTQTDYERTKLAVTTPGIDMVVERGWYSSIDFWSPKIFNHFLFPRISELVRLAHKHGKKFGYVMTTGVELLGPRLVDAGVDVLYFVDPVQDKITIEKALDISHKRMTLVGGINTVSLSASDRGKIKDEVHHAMDVLASTNRFILHPVDAIFPDTPWEGLEVIIKTWKEYF